MAKAGKTVTRRVALMTMTVWVSTFGFITACVGATGRFFFPRVLFEPKTRFSIGSKADYGLGVSTEFQASQRVWVVRDPGRLFVILAKCTHLGCTPDWKPADSKFKCPCHGSGFDAEGVNFEGPAPRPLDRLYVKENAEGQIIVDKARLYGPARWGDEDAFVVA